MVFECGEDGTGAAQFAGCGRTQLNKVLADLLAVEHSVECRHFVHVHRRNGEDLGHFVHGSKGEPVVVLFLC